MLSAVPDDSAVTLEAAQGEEAEKAEGEGEGDGEEPFADPLAAEMAEDKEEKTDPEAPAAVAETVVTSSEESVKTVSKHRMSYSRQYFSLSWKLITLCVFVFAGGGSRGRGRNIAHGNSRG